MEERKSTEKGRGMRAMVKSLLNADDFHERPEVWWEFAPRKVINPLLSFIYSLDEMEKGRAVTAIGLVMDKMARENMEQARDIMRRLMWNLNDESGCSGWGSGEAMGEIMAGNEGLALEFHRILASYISHEGNHLGNGLLERGVLWGLGRLARERPELVQGSVSDLLLYLESRDPFHRGLACLVLSRLRVETEEVRSALRNLMADDEVLSFFQDERVWCHRVGELARTVLGLRPCDS